MERRMKKMEALMNAKQGAIECNLSEIEAYLKNQLELYKTMVFTEEKKKEAKEVIAQLRKEKKLFQDRIKEIKSEYMKPFDYFFAEASRIAELYDEPICAIDEQIEAFEQQRIEIKHNTVEKIYSELVPEDEWKEIIPLNRIFNSKWLNATFKDKDIKEEIMTKKISAKQAIETIKSMESEKEADAIQMYKNSFDLTKCILLMNDYEKQKREIMAREAERLQKEAEERIRSDERAKLEAEQQKAIEIEQAMAEAVEALIPDDAGEEINSYSYIINMTASAKEKLELYMNSIGIEFEEMLF